MFYRFKGVSEPYSGSNISGQKKQGSIFRFWPFLTPFWAIFGKFLAKFMVGKKKNFCSKNFLWHFFKNFFISFNRARKTGFNVSLNNLFRLCIAKFEGLQSWSLLKNWNFFFFYLYLRFWPQNDPQNTPKNSQKSRNLAIFFGDLNFFFFHYSYVICTGEFEKHCFGTLSNP